MIGTLVRKQYFNSTSTVSSQTNVSNQNKLGIGLKLSDLDVNWSQQSKTLILVLQTTCHFCNESSNFYKHLIEDIQDKNIKVIAVFPNEVEESATHLKQLGFPNIEIKQASLDSLNVTGTPTLLLTNEKGEITNFWVGKLTPDKETEVLNVLKP